MMVRPGPTAITSPVESTAATSGWSDFQLTLPGGTARAVLPQRAGLDHQALARQEGRGAGLERQDGCPGRAGGPPCHRCPGPVMRMAVDARRPWTRASTFARPGLTPTTAPVLADLGDQRVGAPESEAGIGDEVALAVVGRGEEGLPLPPTARVIVSGVTCTSATVWARSGAARARRQPRRGTGGRSADEAGARERPHRSVRMESHRVVASGMG